MLKSRGFRFKFLIGFINLLFIYIFLILLDSSTKNETEADNEAQNELNVDFLNRENKNHFLEKSSQSYEKLHHELNYELDSDKAYLNSLDLAIQTRLTQKSIEQRYKTELTGTKRSNATNQFLIVEFTNVFFKPKFCDKSSEQIFNSKLEKCSYQNCKYTCDKSEKAIRRADALVFHQRDLEAELELKYAYNLEKWLQETKQLPFKSSETKLANNPSGEQVWILWNDEATRMNQNFKKISSLFNWTLSFKTNSEIYEGSYGFFRKKTAQTSPAQIKKLKDEIYENHFKKRTNAILWFVNNCKVKSRFRTVLEISRFYPITIYTRCDVAKLTQHAWLNRNYPMLSINSSRCDKESECERENFSRFKYYIAFENKNCSDYITEKTWKALSAHMIPIVSQPSRESYEQSSIPGKAFIHMQDFGFSGQRLAKHLSQVDADFGSYYSYIKWTYVYLRVNAEPQVTEPHRMCHMCEMLNRYKKKIFYTDLVGFFNDQCID